MLSLFARESEGGRFVLATFGFKIRRFRAALRPRAHGDANAKGIRLRLDGNKSRGHPWGQVNCKSWLLCHIDTPGTGAAGCEWAHQWPRHCRREDRVVWIGAKAAANTHHPQRMNSFYAYKPFTHQHVPEIEQELESVGDWKANGFHDPLLPVSRGIFASIYVEVKEDLN